MEHRVQLLLKILLFLEWDYFLALFLNIFFTYLTGSWMHQDWAYLSLWQWVFNELGFNCVSMPPFWTCLIQLNALKGIWIFFNPKAACLFLQRRCEALSFNGAQLRWVWALLAYLAKGPLDLWNRLQFSMKIIRQVCQIFIQEPWVV